MRAKEVKCDGLRCETPQSCAKAVSNEQPSANGVSYGMMSPDVVGSNHKKCWAEYGWENIKILEEGDKGYNNWITCKLEHRKKEIDSTLSISSIDNFIKDCV